MLSHCKRFTQKWQYVQHLQLGIRPRVEWSPVHEAVQSGVYMHVFHGCYWNQHQTTWWKFVGRMPSVFTAKWQLHAIFLAAVSTSCSTVIRAALQLKNHGMSEFPWCHALELPYSISFFYTNGICWLRLFVHHYFLPFFFHGWSSFELEERCLLRGGGNGGSRGPFSFSGTCAFPLTPSDFFSFGSESLSETSMHPKAEPRFEPSPMVQPTGPWVPFGLACSHDMSAGDTKTPAWTARARRHISMM